MSRLIRLSLILCLVLTGHALASARGQAHIGQTVVLCSGQSVVITYGPDGTPQEAPRYCPDMALAMLAATATQTAAPATAGAAHPFLFSETSRLPVSAARIAAQARDPPPAGLG